MTLTTVLRTFRDDVRKISPPWLQNGLAEKILYAVGLHVDVFGDALADGVKLRFPGVLSDESLSLLGRERRIRRGRTETTASYAARLNRWLTDHRRRGGPYAMLAQLYAYFAPAAFPMQLIYYSGRRYSMDVAGAVVRDDIVWSPDADTARWARWWLFYYTDLYPSPTADQIEDLKLIPREWNAAHCLGTIVLFPSGTELWDFPPAHTWDETGVWDPAGAPQYIAVDD